MNLLEINILKLATIIQKQTLQFFFFLETGQCSECIKLQLTYETVFRSFNAPGYRKFHKILHAGTYLKKFIHEEYQFAV